jgi:uncharacterized caspase-like protein
MPPPGEVGTASFLFDDVQKAMEQSKARLSILVMDACRSNPYRSATRAWDQGLAPVDAGLGSYIAFAAGPGQTADDNPGERNGLFTKFLLKELQQQQPLSQVFRRVRDAVYEASGKRQRPYLVDQIIGDLLFRAPAPIQADSAPSPTDRALPAQDSMAGGLGLYRQGKCVNILRTLSRRTPPEWHISA